MHHGGQEELQEVEERATVRWSDASLNTAEVEVGSLLDVRDTENIWCVARVEEVLRSRNPGGRERKVYKIHYIGWDRVFDEYIPQNSMRLAPHEMFTSREGSKESTKTSPSMRVATREAPCSGAGFRTPCTTSTG